MELYQLKKGAQYRIQKDFADFYRNQFLQGEILTFVEYQFVPYHGGYTIVFQEKKLYLQEEQNAQILDALSDYLRLSTE